MIEEERQADTTRRPLIFELGDPEWSCPSADSASPSEGPIDAMFPGLHRECPPNLPNVSELDIMRHYSRLAAVNFGVDTGMYPLGSCTMKYNPRLNEDVCRLPGFAGLHPYQPESTVQGILELLHGLQSALSEITGLPGVSLQPSAGAHGEHTALLCIREFHSRKGNPRRKVLIPDTAHGTNPATVSLCGYEAQTIPSDSSGGVDLDALYAALGEDVAAVMLTNPNTLGLFDLNIEEITRAVRACGAFSYCDGANLNAIMGISRPGDMGFDSLHVNLHKTFSTPHGGGGPGAGPVCVSEELAPFLPGPVILHGDDGYRIHRPSASIGRVRSFYGNVGVLIRAYAYILSSGGDGLRAISEQAVLSANYLMSRLRAAYDLPYNRTCMHEFVLSASPQKRANGVKALDIGKRLLDYGIHPPTVYFPLLVEEALMIEPTETEPLSALDRFVSAMLAIADEAEANPDALKAAPHTTAVRRLDEARAARDPDLRWTAKNSSS
ncbi:MAG: aminomethyl-transferring glycine dehydrogenase subunit GcvPB [Actinobacteria bacterium]|nr:aminomethyl-transferring glycine dehydrogenase subunit GcvPB [Actinomycetota bacterium]MCL5887612.1 aminomethyl-transferring glycine dehydrogenase subunit GcvPB [Actinomycetota bacterium]